MDAGFFRGTSIDQDGRFANKEKKLMKTLVFEPILDTKVVLSKVNLDVIKPWIAKRINEILGLEDELVIQYIYELLEATKVPDPKKIQIQIAAFLQAYNARIFMKDLWDMLVSAQKNASGIPEALIEQKKTQLKLSKDLNNNEKNELNDQGSIDIQSIIEANEKSVHINKSITDKRNRRLSRQNRSESSSELTPYSKSRRKSAEINRFHKDKSRNRSRLSSSDSSNIRTSTNINRKTNQRSLSSSVEHGRNSMNDRKSDRRRHQLSSELNRKNKYKRDSSSLDKHRRASREKRFSSSENNRKVESSKSSSPSEGEGMVERRSVRSSSELNSKRRRRRSFSTDHRNRKMRKGFNDRKRSNRKRSTSSDFERKSRKITDKNHSLRRKFDKKENKHRLSKELKRPSSEDSFKKSEDRKSAKSKHDKYERSNYSSKKNKESKNTQVYSSRKSTTVHGGCSKPEMELHARKDSSDDHKLRRKLRSSNVLSKRKNKQNENRRLFDVSLSSSDVKSSLGSSLDSTSSLSSSSLNYAENNRTIERLRKRNHRKTGNTNESLRHIRRSGVNRKDSSHVRYKRGFNYDSRSGSLDRKLSIIKLDKKRKRSTSRGIHKKKYESLPIKDTYCKKRKLSSNDDYLRLGSPKKSKSMKDLVEVRDSHHSNRKSFDHKKDRLHRNSNGDQHVNSMVTNVAVYSSKTGIIEQSPRSDSKIKYTEIVPPSENATKKVVSTVDSESILRQKAIESFIKKKRLERFSKDSLSSKNEELKIDEKSINNVNNEKK